MKQGNVLILLSDEHNAEVMGCAGHPFVKTPNLDALSAAGVRFTSAYTNSPICVPARAAIATGRYVHQNRCWDNAIAYDGRSPSWGHRLQEKGIPVDSIGKLHYRNETDPTGFDHQYLPVHIMDGIGQVWGSVREPLPDTIGPMPLFKTIGAGESNYNKFDRHVADRAIAWLADRERENADRPWVLFVSMVAPHFPLIVPQKYLDMYPVESIPMPRLRPEDGYKRHPWVERQVRFTDHDAAVGDDARKRLALASYYGLTTFMDEQMGRVLAALEQTRYAANTTIIYSSDHGDNMGVRGTWNKCLMYKESTAVPLIVRGPGVPAGRVVDTPVSHVDLYPTILAAVGLDQHPDDGDLPGMSLLQVAAEPVEGRLAFSEFHAIGTEGAGYMIADTKFKYHEYVGYEPELFDLVNDPGEVTNLAGDPAYTEVLARYAQALRTILDPVATDREAKRDQARLIESFGGREQALKVGTPAATPIPQAALA